VVGVGCYNDMLTDICVALYQRDAAYDYTSAVIKQAGGGDADASLKVADALKDATLNMAR